MKFPCSPPEVLAFKNSAFGGEIGLVEFNYRAKARIGDTSCGEDVCHHIERLFMFSENHVCGFFTDHDAGGIRVTRD